jgi:two-component system sensor kinase FixL
MGNNYKVKTAKQKPKLELKLRKPNIKKRRLSGGKPLKTGKPPDKRILSKAEQLLLRGFVSDLSNVRDDLGEKVRRQTDELKLKSGQLRHGADRQQRSDKRIQKQTDELKLKSGQLRHGAVRQLKSDEHIQILTQAIKSMTNGMFLIDVRKPNFLVVFSNAAFQTMTGYTERELLGRGYFSLRGAKADSGVVAEIKRTIRQGTHFRGEMLGFKRAGQQYWFQLRLAPVCSASGAITHYVGIQTDVTLMWQRDFEIKEQREELLHVTRVGKLAEFVSSLAHEISQPLTAILSYTNAAQRLLADREPQIREILQYINNDDIRATEVIRRLRSLLKRGEPEIKPLDMNALVKDTVVLMTTDATIRNTVLKIKFDARLPLINGDRIQLQQVLLNLISNSFDAMECGPEDRQILINTARRDRDTIAVTVKDTGCGIPTPNMPKLFSRFFTSKSDGLGMGLSISRSIVEGHGGRLDGTNNPGRGATFFFTLPIKQKPAP